jgi:DNA repair photolyase
MTRAMGMPFRWALNPYRGCTHACEYCYARKYQRHLELGAGDDLSSVILVKRNLAAVLKKEITRPSWTREGIAVGTATDPYQPIEGHYRITRQALEVMADADTPFSIVTKGPMVVRDIDVLARATARAGAKVFFSVPSVDQRAWSTLEPGTASPEQRLRAARALVDAGIEAAVLMMPLVPGISTSRTSIDTTVRAIADAGVRLAGSCVARFEPGVREHFFPFLEGAFPALVDGYGRLYGAGANVKKDYAASVKALVEDAAARAGLRPARAAS